MKELYDVYKVPYMTYDEVHRVMELNKASFETIMSFRSRVAYGLPFDDAKAMVEQLGFGHSMHPTK